MFVPPSIYVGGYVATSEWSEHREVLVIGEETEVVDFRYYRLFENSWLSTIFWPAAKVEALILGVELQEYGESGYEFFP